MKFNEFMAKNPTAVREAAKCKDINEFEKMVKSNGIEYEGREELEAAWKYVKSDGAELGEDELTAAAGGKKTETDSHTDSRLH